MLAFFLAFQKFLLYSIVAGKNMKWTQFKESALLFFLIGH